MAIWEMLAMSAICRRHVVTKDMSRSYRADTLIPSTTIIRYHADVVTHTHNSQRVRPGELVDVQAARPEKGENPRFNKNLGL